MWSRPVDAALTQLQSEGRAGNERQTLQNGFGLFPVFFPFMGVFGINLVCNDIERFPLKKRLHIEYTRNV